MPHFLNERTVITIVDDISQAVSTYLIDSVFNVIAQGHLDLGLPTTAHACLL